MILFESTVEAKRIKKKELKKLFIGVVSIVIFLIGMGILSFIFGNNNALKEIIQNVLILIALTSLFLILSVIFYFIFPIRQILKITDKGIFIKNKKKERFYDWNTLKFFYWMGTPAHEQIGFMLSKNYIYNDAMRYKFLGKSEKVSLSSNTEASTLNPFDIRGIRVRKKLSPFSPFPEYFGNITIYIPNKNTKQVFKIFSDHIPYRVPQAYWSLVLPFLIIIIPLMIIFITILAVKIL